MLVTSENRVTKNCSVSLWAVDADMFVNDEEDDDEAEQEAPFVSAQEMFKQMILMELNDLY